MAYYSDIETDRRLAELEKKIAKEYRAANKDLTRTAQEYFEKFEKRYKKEYAAYQDGKYTKAQFDAWVKAQVMRGEHWQHLRDQAAERMTHTNTIAAAYINSDMPSIWALNFNYEGYRAEQELRGISFDIADEWTVRRLMTEEPDLLPTLPPEKAINIPKDQLWNRRKITQSVNAAIIRGQGTSELAKSFERVVGMNRTSAIRNARTAYTGAQNGGRQQSYEALAAMGVKVEKQWIATLDGATRPSHMRLDGEIVPYKDTFSNGLQYPGDRAGSPAEVYNCRCTMKAILDGNRNGTRTRRARDEKGENQIVENMTYTGRDGTVSYQKWLKDKQGEKIQRYTLPKDFHDTRNVGNPISQEDLREVLQLAASSGVRISGVNDTSGGFKHYCGEKRVIINLITELGRQTRRQLNGVKNVTPVLRYDNLLGENGQLDVGSFASTSGRVITLNKFFFDDSDYLIKSYDEEVAEGFFAKGTSYTNILDHEYMHCLCNSNGWIEDKVISAIERVAKELGLKLDKFISDEISIYAAGQTGFGSRQEAVAEVFSKLNGNDAAIAEKIFKEAGLI